METETVTHTKRMDPDAFRAWKRKAIQETRERYETYVSDVSDDVEAPEKKRAKVEGTKENPIDLTADTGLNYDERLPPQLPAIRQKKHRQEARDKRSVPQKTQPTVKLERRQQNRNLPGERRHDIPHQKPVDLEDSDTEDEAPVDQRVADGVQKDPMHPITRRTAVINTGSASTSSSFMEGPPDIGSSSTKPGGLFVDKKPADVGKPSSYVEPPLPTAPPAYIPLSYNKESVYMDLLQDSNVAVCINTDMEDRFLYLMCNYYRERGVRVERLSNSLLKSSIEQLDYLERNEVIPSKAHFRQFDRLVGSYSSEGATSAGGPGHSASVCIDIKRGVINKGPDRQDADIVAGAIYAWDDARVDIDPDTERGKQDTDHFIDAAKFLTWVYSGTKNADLLVWDTYGYKGFRSKSMQLDAESCALLALMHTSSFLAGEPPEEHAFTVLQAPTFRLGMAESLLANTLSSAAVPPFLVPARTGRSHVADAAWENLAITPQRAMDKYIRAAEAWHGGNLYTGAMTPKQRAAYKSKKLNKLAKEREKTRKPEEAKGIENVEREADSLAVDKRLRTDLMVTNHYMATLSWLRDTQFLRVGTNEYLLTAVVNNPQITSDAMALTSYIEKRNRTWNDYIVNYVRGYNPQAGDTAEVVQGQIESLAAQRPAYHDKAITRKRLGESNTDYTAYLKVGEAVSAMKMKANRARYALLDPDAKMLEHSLEHWTNKKYGREKGFEYAKSKGDLRKMAKLMEDIAHIDSVIARIRRVQKIPDPKDK